MRLTRAASFLLLGTALLAPARGQQYTISTYAGGAPPPTPTLSVDKAIGYAGALAFDYVGNLYFVSFNCVFRLDGSGVITRVAGISARGYSGDGGPALDAQLSRPAASHWTAQATYSLRMLITTVSARCPQTESSLPWRVMASPGSRAMADPQSTRSSTFPALSQWMGRATCSSWTRVIPMHRPALQACWQGIASAEYRRTGSSPP